MFENCSYYLSAIIAEKGKLRCGFVLIPFTAPIKFDMKFSVIIYFT